MKRTVRDWAEGLKNRRGGARRRAAAAVTAAAATAVALTLGSLFATTQELLEPDAPPVVIAAVLPEEDVAADPAAETEAAEPERKRGVRAALRRFFQRQPRGVKLLLCPLWAAGKAAALLLSALVSALGGPALSALAGLALNLLCLALPLLAAWKLLFPHKPLRKFFSRRNVTGLLVTAGLLTVADALVPLWWDDWSAWSLAVRGLLGVGALAALWRVVFGKKDREITQE